MTSGYCETLYPGLLLHHKRRLYMARQKTFDELTFTDDFMFCKTLQNNEDLCKELLELILGKKIKQIAYPENQKAIEITSDGKGIRLDIYVEDEDETVYDVEMQAVESRNLPKRSRYYQGMIDLNLIERGADYQELKKSYVIFICLNDYFGKGLHKYSFLGLCKEMPELQWEYGYPMAITVICTICVVLYIRFRRAGWL